MAFPAFDSGTCMAERERQIGERYRILPDAREILAALVFDAGKMESMITSLRVDANLVRECASPVWLSGEVRGGICRYSMDAGSPLVKGLVGVHVALFQDARAEEAMVFRPALLSVWGLENHVTPTRLEGLAGVIRLLRAVAAAG